MEAKEGLEMTGTSWNAVHATNPPERPERSQTMAHWLQSSARHRGQAVAMRRKTMGRWIDISWADALAAARALQLALLSEGFTRGNAGCILSNTRPEWMFCDFALLEMGMTSAGIYPTDAPEQVAFIVKDCSAEIVFVEDDEQLDKVLAVRNELPLLRRIVVFDVRGLSKLNDPMVIGWDRFIGLGHHNTDQLEDLRTTHALAVSPDDVAILVYTSGTTGQPKGAMISHANLVFLIEESARLWDLRPRDDRLAFLPLCHIAERYFTYFSLHCGVISNFVEDPATVLQNMREVQPHFMLAVPRVWEKLYSQIRVSLEEATTLQRTAYRLAMRVGNARAEAVLAGQRPGVWLRARCAIADYFVFRNIRVALGLGRARSLSSGGAPISPELIQWYYAIGLELLEVYGMTECGTISANTLQHRKISSVGLAAPFCEIRLSEIGEILIRGQHVFMGYLNLPDKTAEVIRNGWLHTGDVGRIDVDGYLYITERIKDIIITSGGKNITPSEIQNELKFSPYISDALVIGDNRKYLTAIVMLDRENVERVATEKQLAFTDFASLASNTAVRQLIEEDVHRVNKKFSRVESIKRFEILTVELSPEDEEVTPTMKLKRRVVERKYKALIDSLYEERGHAKA